MSTRDPGPIESEPWPEQITARVVDPGPPVRIHGYAVEEDLAYQDSFSSTAYLSLVGELPAPRALACFEVALCFLAPASVAEAPAHAGVVARLAGGSTSAVLGTGLLALLEQAQHNLHRHPALFPWLRGSQEIIPPAEILSADAEDSQSVTRLKAALLAREVQLEALTHPLSRSAALAAVLYAAGLVTPEQQIAAQVLARLPALAAESLAALPARFKTYPMNLPRFDYAPQDLEPR